MKTLVTHESNCKSIPKIQCKICSEFVLENRIDNHVRVDLERRFSKCKFCDEYVRVEDTLQHLGNCEKFSEKSGDLHSVFTGLIQTINTLIEQNNKKNMEEMEEKIYNHTCRCDLDGYGSGY